MDEKKIVACTIMEGRYQNTISVEYDDGSVDDRFAKYYPDELYFSANEFIGLTKKEARNLMRDKDIAYLRS